MEGLHEQLDFRTKVTRAELEALCSDLLVRVSGPIESALKASNMSAVSFVPENEDWIETH